MKEQMQALKGKMKAMGKAIGNKVDEATMSEHELREKNGKEPMKTDKDKMMEAKEATTMPKKEAKEEEMMPVKARPAPAVMSVGRRISK